PAAFVWMMRTVDASSARPAATTMSVRMKGLVRIGGYFKLRSHVGVPLFLPAPARVAPARFPGLQGESAAAAPREAAPPRAPLRMPFHRHGIPPAGALAGRDRVERRADAEELRGGQTLRPSRRADEEPAADDAARARGGRHRVPPGRQALGVEGRSRMEAARRMGERRETPTP